MLPFDGRVPEVVDGDQILLFSAVGPAGSAQLRTPLVATCDVQPRLRSGAWQGRGGLLDATAVGDSIVHAAGDGGQRCGPGR